MSQFSKADAETGQPDLRTKVADDLTAVIHQLRKHQKSHQSWLDHFKVDPNHTCGRCTPDVLAGVGDAVEQEVSVRVYDGLIERVTAAQSLLREALAALPVRPQEERWQPIETCPPHVMRALVYWPTFALNADFEQSDVPTGDGLVAESFRVGGTQWETDMVTEHFEDEAGFGYGDPTHWMPLPDPPASPLVPGAPEGRQTKDKE